MSTVSRVRVRVVPETEVVGAAGRTGVIVGESKPSSSGVAVVGPAPDDFALAVMFDGGLETLWFRPELLELIGEVETSAPPRPDDFDRLVVFLRRLWTGAWFRR
jgi:hypothetical protein